MSVPYLLRRKRALRTAREIVRQITPPIVISVIDKVTGQTRRRARPRRSDMTIAGRTLRIHPESYWALGHFYGDQAEATEEMRNFHALSRGRQRLLDLGSLYGVFSLTMAASGGRALAVEASPSAFALLLYNVHANPDLAITPIECAVSDRSGGNLWIRNMQVGASAHDSSLAVPRMSGDDICQRHGFVPDVIKIDVEGHEAHVLQGLHRVIEGERPMIFLETHPGMYDADHLKTELGWLSSLGYRSLTGPSIDLLADATDVLVLRTVLSCSPGDALVD